MINDVDERFKNLTRRRSDRLAIVLLALSGWGMLLANRCVYPMLELADPRFEILSVALVGIVISEFALLSTWTVLSHQPFAKRLQFLFVAALLLLASWMLGYVSTFSSEVGLDILNRELIYYFGWIPLALIAMSVPLIVVRFFGSVVLAPGGKSEARLVRQPVTISRLMVATGIIASSLALLQLPGVAARANQADIWAASGRIAGVFFLLGLLFVFPTVLILFSTKRRFWIWSPLLLMLSVVVCLGVGILFSVFSGFKINWSIDEQWPPIVAVLASMVCFQIGIGVIRLLGYRLAKTQKN